MPVSSEQSPSTTTATPILTATEVTTTSRLIQPSAASSTVAPTTTSLSASSLSNSRSSSLTSTSSSTDISLTAAPSEPASKVDRPPAAPPLALAPASAPAPAPAPESAPSPAPTSSPISSPTSAPSPSPASPSSSTTTAATPMATTPRPNAIASFSFACTSPSPDLPRNTNTTTSSATPTSLAASDYGSTTPLLVPSHARRFNMDRSSSSFLSQSQSRSVSSDSTTSGPSFVSAGENVFPRPPHLGLASFLLWLKDHPSSSKVGSENMARFLLVKSVSIVAASLGCIYGILFDTESYLSLYSLLLFFIPAIQGFTEASRLCGLALSMAVAAVYWSLQNRLLPLLGPSLETTLLFGLPLVTGMLVGRRVGLLTSLAVIGFSIAEYRSRAKSVDLTHDEASRLWAGFGAYWLSLLFFGTITCLYQWCVEVCVNDANLFKDLAIANAKSKDGVVSSVSHELRTPLAALIGWTELLLSDHTLSSSARSTVSMLHSSTLSLLTILNALLDVSKVTAAKMTTCNQNFNLHDLVLDTARMMTGLSGTRSVELLVDFSAQVPELVRADSGLIKQVLGNLVSNAIKFTDVGYVNVGVSLKDEDDDSVTVEFVVQDTGKGIPDEQKDKLFVEFSQVEGGKCKTHEAGTGLGLFLVKNLVELMKGTVFMHSEVGVGSTFGFVIRMEKQYLAFRTPGYDHVVTVSSAFQGGVSQQTSDTASPILPVTPGLARSTTPRPPPQSVLANTTSDGNLPTKSSSDPEAKDPSKPKDYFNLQPVEETRANANNITLRTRDNAFLSNRQYFIHSQCTYFEDFLWKTASEPWKALSTRRLRYSECVNGWKQEPLPINPLALFGDVYLIDLSPATNRPRNGDDLSDQEHVQHFLGKFAHHLIKLAKARIGKARQASIILFYPFGHPPSLAQEPFVELSSLYQISLCRKPVSERALGSIVKRQLVVIQNSGEGTPSVTSNAPAKTESVGTTTTTTATATSSAPTPMTPMGPDNEMDVMSKTLSDAALRHNSLAITPSRQYSSDSTSSASTDDGYGQADTIDTKNAVFSGEPSLDGFKLTLPRQGLLGIRKKATSDHSSTSSSHTAVNSRTRKGTTTMASPTSIAAAAAVSAATSTHTTSVRFAKRSASSTAVMPSVRSAQPLSDGTQTDKPIKSLLKNQNQSQTQSQSQSQSQHSSGSLASSERKQDVNTSGSRVLIVDDNMVNRNLLWQQLCKLGVTCVDQAKSGQEAVELFTPGVHSLVLMDLNMPNMNGFEATTLIRKKEQEVAGVTADTVQRSNELSRLSEGVLEPDSATGVNEGPWSPERYVGHLGQFSRSSSGSETTEMPLPQASRANGSVATKNKAVTIVALTADWYVDVGEDREKAINGGFDDVMVKPISLPSLSHLLTSHMGNLAA
ncbi:hypothetical protein BGZ94_008535 [Podila epigama]|nr:hypothetical protein BGZ94_008535 [Podila epigama]